LRGKEGERRKIKEERRKIFSDYVPGIYQSLSKNILDIPRLPVFLENTLGIPQEHDCAV